jgi:GNAT superfamily N-acetyltransferase
MPGVQITVAQREDCRALATIHVRSWQAGYASLFPGEYLASLSIDEREDSWISILEVSASRTFIARLDGQALGFATFGRCRDRDTPADAGEIWAFYVAPDAWSGGVGWALWEAARVSMLHRGFARVTLWVLSGNTRGRRFYESVGFVLEAHPEQHFERAGVRLAEVRLAFVGMSSCPAVERAASCRPSRPAGRPVTP